VSETGAGDAEQERLARELAEELRKLRVEDVLVNTLMHVSSIGYRSLGLTEDTREDRDLDQSRLAIETMRALTPVLEKFVPGDLVRDFNASVANLQLAYAKAVSEAGPASAADTSGGQSQGQSPSEGGETPEDPKEGGFEGRATSPADTSGGLSQGQSPSEPSEAPEAGTDEARGGDDSSR
jgi:hypothetical protein